MTATRPPRARPEGDDAPRPATIQDVARLAGVDASTASRVLRGDPNQKVREETRDRIVEAARRLDYRPNAMAQSLRTRRTGTFALIIPSFDDPSFIDVVRGVQMEAAEQEKQVVIVEADALGQGEEGLARREETLSRLALDGRIDGLLAAVAVSDEALTSRLSQRGVPLIAVDRRLESGDGWVAVDDAAAAELAVEHLVSLGHRRIGLIGYGPLADSARRRESGFRKAMGAAGLAIDPRWIASRHASKDGGREAVGEILEACPPDDRPTALFSASLLGAIGALAELQGRGIAVPDEISLVACDDNDVADDTSPPLTTIRLPNVRMGREAMRMAIRAVSGPGGPRQMTIEGPIELVERRSTARSPRGDL